MKNHQNAPKKGHQEKTGVANPHTEAPVASTPATPAATPAKCGKKH